MTEEQRLISERTIQKITELAAKAKKVEKELIAEIKLLQRQSPIQVAKQSKKDMTKQSKEFLGNVKEWVFVVLVAIIFGIGPIFFFAALHGGFNK